VHDSAGTDVRQLLFRKPPGFKFCGQCTTPLALGSRKPQPSILPITVPQLDRADALDGERKTVTALFADIKGSMELMEDLDLKEAHAIADPQSSICCFSSPGRRETCRPASSL